MREGRKKTRDDASIRPPARHTTNREVDAVIVGGGHAGIEAAWALAKLGHRVAIVTFAADALGRMSCNPSIGGLAKGQLVREIDALGGLMGRLIDRTGIHYRMLNRKKGAAVQAPRAQADKPAYCREAFRALAGLSGLTIIEGEVTEIVTEGACDGQRRVVGVRVGPVSWSQVTAGGAHSTGPLLPGESGPPAQTARVSGPTEIACRAVVLTLGTFLDGTLFTGMDACKGGRRGEPPAVGLSSALRRLGLRLGRLKTGTPPRLRGATLDVTRLVVQPGDDPPPRFSFFEEAEVVNHVVCHITHTNERTRQVIVAALDRSPLFGGIIHGVGPRYCPSIEDKVVRFPERKSHHVFLEPEGLDSDEIYPNGISTSLPLDVQQAYVRTIPGLEAAEIVHPGYAVEYDFLLTSQIGSTLRVRGIDGLYTAGQINGTSGYEEAAAQGIMAGLNARSYLEGREEVVLRRSEAYIGVLLDDLITKVPTEPYRMFTSQSEYRLLLRQDNADLRLSARGRELGLLGEDDWRRVEARRARVEKEKQRLHRVSFGRSERAQLAGLRHARISGDSGGSVRPGSGVAALRESDVGRRLAEILRRPEVTLRDLEAVGLEFGLPAGDVATIEADIKYSGYIQRQLKEVKQARSLEDTALPGWVIEDPPQGISHEAREKLREHGPRTLGQASRIPGVTPCDVSLLAVRIHARRTCCARSSGNEQSTPGDRS
jgi:tRNA uridine 5-carboxymethylaminomethyl modification enzyme